MLECTMIFQEIEKTGIRRTDPRLEGFMRGVGQLHERIGDKGTVKENLDVDLETFQALAEENIVFLSQIFRNKLVIPEFQDFCEKIREIYENCKSNNYGNVSFSDVSFPLSKDFHSSALSGGHLHPTAWQGRPQDLGLFCLHSGRPAVLPGGGQHQLYPPVLQQAIHLCHLSERTGIRHGSQVRLSRTEREELQ